MQDRVVNYNSYEDVKEYAKELTQVREVKTGKFNAFITALKLSKLDVNQQLDVLSVKVDKSSLMIAILETEFNTFDTYLDYVDEIIERGATTDKLFTFVKSSLSIFSLKYSEDEKSRYLTWLSKLVAGKSGITSEQIYTLLETLQITTYKKMGDCIAIDGDDEDIQKYIELQIELTKNQIAPVKIQKLNSTKNHFDKSFLDYLIKNSSTRPSHYLQLISHDLITEDQCNRFRHENNHVFSYILKQGDFNNFKVVRFLMNEIITNSITINKDDVTFFIYRFHKSNLSAKEKLACLNMQSSNTGRLGWTLGHFIAKKYPQFINDYFKTLENIPKNLSSAETVVDILSIESFNEKEVVGDILLNDEITSYLSLLKTITKQFPSLANSIVELINRYNHQTKKIMGHAILLSNAKGLNKLIFELRESGISADIMQKYYYAWTTNNNTKNPVCDSLIDYEILYKLLNYGVFSKKIIEKLCHEIIDVKEQIFSHIKTLPTEEKIQALLNATTPTDPEHPLHTLLTVKRGPLQPSPKRGMYKKWKDELVMSIEKQAFQMKKTAPTSSIHEKEDIDLAIALSLSESSHNKIESVETIDILRETLDQHQDQVEDLISFDDQPVVLEQRVVIPEKNKQVYELFSQVEFKEDKTELVVPSHHLDSQGYELPPDLSVYQLQHVIVEEQYDLPPPLEEITKNDKQVVEKKEPAVKVDANKTTNYNPTIFGDSQKNTAVLVQTEKKNKEVGKRVAMHS